MLGWNPSTFPGFDACPVEAVSWYEAVDYCNALSEREDRTPAYELDGTSVTWDPAANGYRLPTESEWEYACRAGTTTAFYSGPITKPRCELAWNLDRIGWYCGNNGEVGDPDYGTKEGGQKVPNAWGLYDASGNVWEWCWDWYGDYPAGPVTDPTGPDSGSSRIFRGGSWLSYADNGRSAYRVRFAPDYRGNHLGFRPAISSP